MFATDRMLEAAFVDIVGASREPDLSVSAVAAQTAALGTSRTAGSIYDLLSDVDCYIKIAEDAGDVTTSSGYPLLAGNVVSFFVPAGYKIGAIAASAGTIKLHRSK